MDTSQYFYRNVIFSKQGDTISLIDIYQPKSKKEKLDSWFGIIIQLADGQHTIDQLYHFVSELYNEGPPEKLQKTLHTVVQLMANSKLIVLTEEKIELPYYLSMPFEMLDVVKAKKLLKEDEDKFNKI